MRRENFIKILPTLFVAAVSIFFLSVGIPAHAASILSPIIPVNQCNCQALNSAPDWGCVLQTLQTAMNDIVAFATIIITIYIAWAGIAFMMSPTSAEGRTQARQRVVNAVIGLLIVLGSWLLIDSLMKVIYNQGATGAGVAQLGPWNTLLSDTNPADQCIKVVTNIPPLPYLGILNPGLAVTTANGGVAPPVQTFGSSTAPAGACGSTTHLNCAAAVAWLQNNVHTTNQYTGACLAFVQNALHAGGLSLQCGAPPGHHGYAGYCNLPLQHLGFTSLDASDPSPQPADILIIQDSGGKKIGHATMWTGSAWVSDTIQLSGESPPGNPYGSAGYNPQYWRP